MRGSATGSAGSAADPWAAADAAPDTPERRKARADAALARVHDIIPKLAKLRDLPLEKPIPAEYQSAADFRAFVHREVEKENAKDTDLSAVLLQMGLVTEPIDLAKAEEQAFATQAAAYYDPAQKKFFLVMVPDSPVMLDAISAHELTHGLQDQHFDLQKYLAEDAKGVSQLDDDQQTARRFVVEGDATLAMFLYAVSDTFGGKSITPQMIGALRGQLEGMANQDTSAMVDAMTAQTGMGSGEMADAMKAMREIPRTILVPMIDSYLKGALVCLDAYEKGGWPAVDDLYTHPPDSTEEVLHPEAKLLAHRDPPHEITLPKLPGYDEVTSGVLGELQWRVYFSLWKHDGGDHVSEDWGGDRFAAVRGKDGKLVVLIATAWDTREAAQRFAQAYGSTVAERVAAKTHAGEIHVKTEGTRVFVVDGGSDAKLVDALAAGAKIAP
ncbi:MAG: hypothetical protein ACM31C_33495 [Acidobacteriota bacterium]